MLVHIEALITFVGIILLASLLVTVITQIMSATLNLRGTNLRWGLIRLLIEIEPSLKQQAREVVEKILYHPLITKSERRLPSVIRMEEFSRLLIQLGEADSVPGLKDGTLKALRKLTRIDPKALEEQLDKLPQELELAGREKISKAPEIIRKQLDLARVRITELEGWFDNMTDRISERFTKHSRIITVIASFVVVLALQLNTFQILERAHSDPEIRARLFSSAELIMQRAEDILENRTIYDLAMDSLRESIPSLPVPHRSFNNHISAERWLQANIPAGEDLESAFRKYRDYQSVETEKRLGYLGDQVIALRSDLELMGLQVIGEEYSLKFWEWKYSKFLGLLVSIALLSLGSPFWFNILKNLTNLRTRLMQNEETERLQRKRRTEAER